MLLKVGLVGCGKIAQIMYLPYLRELGELYEIEALCDVSRDLVNKLSKVYNVRNTYTDYHKMLEESGMQAVIILTPFNHSEVALLAARRGIHILTEKPMCISLKEADEMVISARKKKIKLMVGNMRMYNPAYEVAKNMIAGIKEKRFIRLHTSCGITAGAPEFLNQLTRIYSFPDVSEEVKKEETLFVKKHLEEIGGLSEASRNLYINILLGAIHDIYILRGLFGKPRKIVLTDVWKDWVISLLDYGEGLRCSYTMGSTANVSDFEAGITVYGADRIVALNFQPSYVKNAPAEIHVREMEEGNFVRKLVTASWEESFKRELIHFYECILKDLNPLTSGEAAREDLKLLIEICRAYRRG